MDIERMTASGRWVYSVLIRLYPESFRRRFGEGLRQTFNDMVRESEGSPASILLLCLTVYLETLAAIGREWMRIMWLPILRVAVVTLLLLSVPWIAMKFTDEVVWTLSDFVVGGLLLGSAGMAFELLAMRAGRTIHKAAIALAVGTSLILVWMNLAVGLIGSEDNPANLLYLAVLTTGIVGAGLSRFRPAGMSRALLATAIVQAIVPAVALAIWRPDISGEGMVGVIFLNALFVLLFAGSALLFRRAHEELLT